MMRAKLSIATVFGVLIASGTLAAEAELGPLIEKLRKGDAEAKQRLIAVGVPAIGPLFGLLGDKEARAASEAHSALRWIAMRAADATTPAERRKQAVEAIAPFVDSKQPPAARRVAVELIGLVGTEAEVPLLAKVFLQDRSLANEVVAAFSRIGGETGRGALICIVAHDARHLIGYAPELAQELGEPKSAEPALKARALDLLASRTRPGELPAEDRDLLAQVFSDATKDPNEDVRLAALRGIGALGIPTGEASLVEALRGGTPKARAAAFQSYLALASGRLRAKDAAAARAMHERALELAANDEERAAALLGLGRVGDPASLPTIAQQMKSESREVRFAAHAALCQIQGPAGAEAIVAALPDAPKEARPLLLEALGKRRDPSSATRLLAAAKESDEGVALAAVRALGELGDPAAATALLDLAGKEGAPKAVKAAAVPVAIRLAQLLADRGQGSAAFAILDPALKLAEADADRREAILGMGCAADPKALETLAPLLAKAETPLRAAAIEACLGLGDAAAKRGDRESAVAAYSLIADAAPKEALGVEAIKKLTTLGVLYDLAGRFGYAATWWVIGPFPCGDLGGAPKKAWFPETEIDLKKAYKVDDRTLRWRLEHFDHPKGWVVLKGRLKPDERVLAYAYVELAAEADQEVRFSFGRDDGLTLWLNGKPLYDKHDGFSIDREAFVVPARLAKGLNRILIKSSQGGADWAFYLRLTDIAGKPLRARAGR